MRLKCGKVTLNMCSESADKCNKRRSMTLSDKLKKCTQTRGQGQQAFLAQRREIARALKAGYPAKTVWSLLHEKGTMPVQYRTFMEYVNRYLKDNGQPQSQPAEISSLPPLNKSKSVTQSSQPPLAKRFQFDAKGKTKEELI